MELLTVRQVAQILKVNRNFVYDQISKGNLKAMRMGSIKIKETALNDFINDWETKNMIGDVANV